MLATVGSSIGCSRRRGGPAARHAWRGNGDLRADSLAYPRCPRRFCANRARGLLSDELRVEIEHLKATDPDEYEHVYEGMCRQSVQGAVYRNELLAADKEGRICRVPYDASKLVDTFWDLGYFDNVAIWLAQSVGFEFRFFEFRFIDFIQGSQQVDRSRLTVDSLKWYLCKLAPKKYGDKIDATLSGPDGGPIQEHLTVEYIRQKD